MPKRTAQSTRTGQLSGVQLEISGIHNDGLRESVTLINRGTVVQPMGGWALATLRGERFYFFPDDLILRPGKMVTVHSGQDAPDMSSAAPHELQLVWAHEQMWNNGGDMAVLFDANGVEVDRYAYPHERIMGSGNRRRKRLLHDGETWCIEDQPA